MVEAAHLLLDHLRDGVLNGFRRSARYVALIWMDGGAMVGYCATGSVKIDARPASIRTMAITHARSGDR